MCFRLHRVKDFSYIIITNIITTHLLFYFTSNLYVFNRMIFLKAQNPNRTEPGRTWWTQRDDEVRQVRYVINMKKLFLKLEMLPGLDLQRAGVWNLIWTTSHACEMNFSRTSGDCSFYCNMIYQANTERSDQKVSFWFSCGYFLGKPSDNI